MTTPTSGSIEMFIINKGRVLLFAPSSKYNAEYSKNYIILQILDKGNVINESKLLF